MKEKSFIEEITDNCHRVEERIAEACVRAGRSREEVTLIGVSKTVAPERVQAAVDAGVTRLGENHVQELCEKQPLVGGNPEWHLIGHLQTNKVKQVVGKVALIQSVDSVRLAKQIEKVSAAQNFVTPVLVEVNIGREPTKSGVFAPELPKLLEDIAGFSHLSVQGLMCVPPISDSPDKKRNYFAKMHNLFLDIQEKKLDNIDMHILSMGMSSDFEEAILEGSTMIRVGTALFGRRNYL